MVRYSYLKKVILKIGWFLPISCDWLSTATATTTTTIIIIIYSCTDLATKATQYFYL